MSKTIKVVLPLLDEMSKTFDKGEQQLQDTAKEMKAISAAMQGGALLGQGGKAFAEALNTTLAQQIGKLAEKFRELSKDVQDAKQEMIEADKSSASGMG